MKILGLILAIVLSCSSVYADTYEAKYNTAQYLPVIMLDSIDGSAETGVVYTDVTIYYKEGIAGTVTAFTLLATDCATPTSGDWCEDDATNIPGSYRFYVPATVLDTKGKVFYNVKGSGFRPYYGLISIKTETSDEESDTIQKIDKIRR